MILQYKKHPHPNESFKSNVFDLKMKPSFIEMEQVLCANVRSSCPCEKK